MAMLKSHSKLYVKAFNQELFDKLASLAAEQEEEDWS